MVARRVRQPSFGQRRHRAGKSAGSEIERIGHCRFGLPGQLPKLCRKGGMKVVRPLSFYDLREEHGGQAAPDISKQDRSKLRADFMDRFPVLGKILVYTREKIDPDQKRYQVIEQVWIRKAREDRIVWETE